MPIYISPGASFEADAQNLAPNLTGTVGVTLKTAPAGGTVVTARTTAGITEEPVGSGHYGKSNFVAPDDGGQFWLFWDSGVDTEPIATEEVRVAYTNPAAVTGPTFATPWDVEARLLRALTDAEVLPVDYLLLAATGVMTDAVDKDAEWAAGDDVPTIFRFVAADMVVRALLNAPGISTTREALGAFSYSTSFVAAGEGGGLWLSALEERMLRRAVWGLASGSAVVASIVDDLGANGVESWQP